MIKHEELFRHRNGLCGKDCPTPQPVCSHGPDWKRDGFCVLCKRETQKERLGELVDDDLAKRFAPQPELSRCCGKCWKIYRDGFAQCGKVHCPCHLEPVKEEGKVTMKRIECEGVGDNNGFYEMTFTPPQDEDWEKTFDEKHPVLGEKDVDPIFRYCRLDLPDGDSRSIKSFIESLINKERVKAKQGRYVPEYEEALKTQARHDAFKEVQEWAEAMFKEAERARSKMKTRSGKNWKKAKKRVSGAKIALEELVSFLSQKSHE